jgi:hypothetical protein
MPDPGKTACFSSLWSIRRGGQRDTGRLSCRLSPQRGRHHDDLFQILTGPTKLNKLELILPVFDFVEEYATDDRS